MARASRTQTVKALFGLGRGSNTHSVDTVNNSIDGTFATDTAIAAADTAAVAAHAALVATTGVHGLPKIVLANGTAAATDVTIAGIAVGDTLISVLAFATAAAISTVADRTSEYVVAAGKLTKAAGTNETNNQLVIFYTDAA